MALSLPSNTHAQAPTGEADPAPGEEPDAAPEGDPPGAGDAAASDTPSRRLRDAREAFQRSRFERVRPLLLPTLEPVTTLDGDDVIEARTLLAVSVFFEAQQLDDPGARDELVSLARDQFLSILLAKPDHEIDPRVYPASVVDLYSEVREEHAEAIDAARKERGAGEDPIETGLRTIYFERGVRERYYALNFAPFGIGQFQNGDESAGTAFAILQSAALILNVSAYFIGVSLIDPETGTVAIEDLALARQMQTLQLGALATFGGLWLSSAGYAVYRYESTEFLQIRTLDAPPPELVPATSLMLNFKLDF